MTIRRDKTSKPKPVTGTQSTIPKVSQQPNVEQIQRFISDSSSENLTPDTLMYLQRTIGNHALRDLLPKSSERGQENGLVQRSIVKGRNRTPIASADTAAQDIYDSFKHNQSIESEFKTFDQLKALITLNAIKAEILTRQYLTDNVVRNVLETAKLVYPVIENDLIRNQTTQQNAVVDGIKVSPIASASVGDPRAIKSPSSKVDFHAPAITFDATVGIETPSAQIAGNYVIGLTQTVISVDRYFNLIADGAKGKYEMGSVTTLSQPTNDRNANSQPPWYNANAYSALANGLQVKKVSLFDMPGEDFSSNDSTFTVKSIKGIDKYQTWLILYNTVTQSATFLREWTWTVDYFDTKIVTTVDDPLGKAIVGIPKNAMLTGERARDLLKPEWKFAKL